MVRALPGLLQAIALLSASPAWAGGNEAPACPTDGWVTPLPPKFEVYLCQRRTFVPEQNFHAGSASRVVSGSRRYIEFDLKSGTPYEQGVPRSAFIAEVTQRAKTLGAKLLGTDDHFLMFEKGKQVLVVQLFGDKTLHAMGFTTAETTPKPQQMVLRNVPLDPLPTAEAVKAHACADPSWVAKSFPAYRPDECTVRVLDDAHAISVKTEDGKTVSLTGPSLTVQYSAAAPASAGRLQTLEVPAFAYDNATAAFKAAGFKETGGDSSTLYAHAPSDRGDFWLLFSSSGGNSDGMGGYLLTTVQRLVKTCTMQFYGVNFDFDKATIRADSDPELKKILALFTQDPSYAAEIGGHTDNVGQSDYNLRLSEERAAAVKAWLVARGVADNRITTHGYGDSAPLVPNDSDANRAKNRRVELKRDHCVEK